MEQHFILCKWPVITDQNLENPNKPDFFGTKVDKIYCFAWKKVRKEREPLENVQTNISGVGREVLKLF